MESNNINWRNEENQLNEFIDKHPRGNIFQSQMMLDVYNSYRKYDPKLITLTNKGELIGMVLSVIQKEHQYLLGKYTSRAIIWGGPLVKDNRSDFLNQVLQKYNQEISGKAIYSQFRNIWPWSEEEKKVFLSNGYSYVGHLNIIHNLTQPIDQQFLLVHKGRRKNIRRAEKLSLQFEEIFEQNQLEACLALIEDTYKRIKLPVPDRSFFYKSFNVLGKKNILKIFVARWHDIIIGTRMVLCYKDLIYDWYAGADNNHLNKYPNDFLPWKVMEWGSINGYKYFDFGGAGKPGIPYGVRDYKSKFGGDLVNYGRFEKVHKPFLMLLGRIGIKLYGLINDIRK